MHGFSSTRQPRHDPGAEFRIEQMLDPSVYPHEVESPSLRQTPLSWVILTGPYAYKIKRPVRFEFIDASTLARRAWLCRQELELNRRFARDLYVEVVPISCENHGLRVGGAGQPVEFAVKMRQFDPGQELGEGLERGTITQQDVTAIATAVADAHGQAPAAPPDSPHGSLAQLQALMTDNFTLLCARSQGPARDTLERLQGWTQERLAALEPLIAKRKAAGRVRECHGDLHARNIVRWHQQWLPFDCLEFDPALRWIDVMSDVAFLYMDLMAHRRRDLACGFLSRYLEQTGDYDGLPLLPLFAVYRALVRAKLDALDAATASPVARKALQPRLAGRLQVARELMEKPAPALILMHGVAASGKSWLSERLVPALHAVRIRADLERKRMAGVAPLTHRKSGVDQGPYTPESRQRTYQRMLDCADAALQGGCNVIVDASFLLAAQRNPFFGLAARRGIRLLIASCHAGLDTLHSRLETRARGGLDPSEATLEVLEQQLRTREPLNPDELRQSVRIDTSRMSSADAGIEAVKERLRGADSAGAG